MSKTARISGGGVAACCCAALLNKAGYRVFADRPGRAGSPMLMLSDQTQRLLRDVFDDESFLEGAVKINKRLVAWGQGRETAALPHSGLVVSESALLARLWPTLNIDYGEPAESDSWKVISNQRELPAVTIHGFGSRVALTNAVALKAAAENDACWVESAPAGWLFLIPCGGNKGSLISVGAPPAELLTQSVLVAEQISELLESTGTFPAYPRIVTPLCAPRWIACGTAAIAFDPISGEGAGNALREGILASAVIRASVDGGPENELLNHYANRLLRGFLRHLLACCQFYSNANAGPWWQAELEQLKAGVAWAQEEVNSSPPSLFRLTGFELHRLSV